MHDHLKYTATAIPYLAYCKVMFCRTTDNILHTATRHHVQLLYKVYFHTTMSYRMKWWKTYYDTTKCVYRYTPTLWYDNTCIVLQYSYIRATWMCSAARYMPATLQLQDCLEGNGARVSVAKRRALHDVWLKRIVAILNVDAAYDDKL